MGAIWGAIVAAAVVAFTPSGAEARTPAGWKIAPAAGWVAPAPADPAKGASVDASALEYLLDDTQVRVSAANVEHFHHAKYRPHSSGQVEDGSQLELEFNPAHERLILHHAHVVRDGRVIFALTASDVRIVQRERGLEERIYDGTLTAVIFLRDVRADDVVDYAYTVEGANPLLGGKYVTRFPLTDGTFTAAWRRRILLPVARSLTVKAHGLDVAPRVTAAGAWREYLWERRDLTPVEAEDGLPGWFDGYAWVDASEFGSWAEVAGLYERLFPPRRPPSPAMAAELAKLRARGGTDEERLLAATRFVQDDIRYLGLEVGLSGHKPFEPAVVFDRRYGDCKDKTVLLVSLLSELGFLARPALVDTDRRRGLDDVLPSPLAFDHAIVQVTVGGVSHFIDATQSYQRGPLSTRQPPPFERALLIAADTRGLVPIPQPVRREPSVSVREILAAPADGLTADLEVETTLRSDAADEMRARLAGRSKKDIAREYLNYYAEDDAEVSPTSELEVTDDERLNVLVLRERYRLGGFWHDAKRELRVSTLADHLKNPGIRLRRMPFALEFPLNVAHTTIVRMPTLPSVDPYTMDLGDDHVRFAFSVRTDGNDRVIRYELQTLTDSVPPEKAARFFAVVDAIRARTGYVLHRSEHAHAGTPPYGVIGLVIVGGVVLTMLVIGVREAVRSARKRSFKKKRRFESGEAASAAIEVSSEDEVEARVAALKCGCGGRHQVGTSAAERVAYDGRALIVVKAKCAACGKERGVFLAVRAAAG